MYTLRIRYCAMGLRDGAWDVSGALALNPTMPHGKVVLHLESIKDSFKMVGAVESMTG